MFKIVEVYILMEVTVAQQPADDFLRLLVTIPGETHLSLPPEGNLQFIPYPRFREVAHRHPKFGQRLRFGSLGFNLSDRLKIRLFREGFSADFAMRLTGIVELPGRVIVNSASSKSFPEFRPEFFGLFESTLFPEPRGSFSKRRYRSVIIYLERDDIVGGQAQRKRQ
jgi:hypothetical protein